MAKGARSNSKKAVRAQRRQKLNPTWQAEADARRYAALAEAAAAEPIPITVHVPAEADPVEEGRARKQKKDSMHTDSGAAVAAGKGKKRKGINVKGVQKRHNKKKMSALWASEFHKKKSGKQGLQ